MASNQSIQEIFESIINNTDANLTPNNGGLENSTDVGGTAIKEEIAIVNDTVSTLNVMNAEHGLAPVVNGQSINTPYIIDYLNVFHNFSDTSFEHIDTEKVSTVMKVGNVMDDIKGYILDNKNYVIHLIHCDENANACAFRVNGVPTTRLYPSDVNDTEKQTIFNINGNYSIKIKSIIFNYCDNKNICDLYYEAYDVVEVEVTEE